MAIRAALVEYPNGRCTAFADQLCFAACALFRKICVDAHQAMGCSAMVVDSTGDKRSGNIHGAAQSNLHFYVNWAKEHLDEMDATSNITRVRPAE